MLLLLERVLLLLLSIITIMFTAIIGAIIPIIPFYYYHYIYIYIYT